MPDRPTEAERLTVLLQASTSDASHQRSAAFGAVYQELKAIARRQMRAEPAHTLQATALVHEAWLRLFGTRQQFASDSEFLAAAANTMRRVLIDHARGRGRQKRGAGVRPVPLDAVELATRADADELLAIDEAVAELERRDPRLAEQRNCACSPASTKPRSRVHSASANAPRAATGC